MNTTLTRKVRTMSAGTTVSSSQIAALRGMSIIRRRFTAWFDRWSDIAASIDDSRDPCAFLGGYLT